MSRSFKTFCNHDAIVQILSIFGLNTFYTHVNEWMRGWICALFCFVCHETNGSHFHPFSQKRNFNCHFRESLRSSWASFHILAHSHRHSICAHRVGSISLSFVSCAFHKQERVRGRERDEKELNNATAAPAATEMKWDFSSFLSFCPLAWKFIYKYLWNKRDSAMANRTDVKRFDPLRWALALTFKRSALNEDQTQYTAIESAL